MWDFSFLIILACLFLGEADEKSFFNGAVGKSIIPILDSMGDYGRRDKKNDKGSDHTIEEQIILRVPPAIAEGVRTLLKGKQTNADSDLSFEMRM